MAKRSVQSLTTVQIIKNLLENKNCQTCTHCQFEIANNSMGIKTKGCRFNVSWHLGDNKYRYLKPLNKSNTCKHWVKNWRFNENV
jgi:hypothetical protein